MKNNNDNEINFCNSLCGNQSDSVQKWRHKILCFIIETDTLLEQSESYNARARDVLGMLSHAIFGVDVETLCAPTDGDGQTPIDAWKKSGRCC